MYIIFGQKELAECDDPKWDYICAYDNLFDVEDKIRDMKHDNQVLGEDVYFANNDDVYVDHAGSPWYERYVRLQVIFVENLYMDGINIEADLSTLGRLP